MKLNTNIYHQEYAVGDYLKLIQLYYQRNEYERLVLNSEDLVQLISRRKINCRYVKVKKVIMKITERIEYDHLTAGFMGVIEQSELTKLGIAHNQYPSYKRALKEKFKWRVYWVNLSAHGKVVEEVYEDRERVIRLIANRYIPAQLRLAIEPGSSRAAGLSPLSARWE